MTATVEVYAGAFSEYLNPNKIPNFVMCSIDFLTELPITDV